MGFTAVMRHHRRAITLFRQGGVNFLVNAEPDSFAARFAAKHGPSACGFAVRFREPARAVQAQVLAPGGDRIEGEASKAVQRTVVAGLGGALPDLRANSGSLGRGSGRKGRAMR